MNLYIGTSTRICLRTWAHGYLVYYNAENIFTFIKKIKIKSPLNHVFYSSSPRPPSNPPPPPVQRPRAYRVGIRNKTYARYMVGTFGRSYGAVVLYVGTYSNSTRYKRVRYAYNKYSRRIGYIIIIRVRYSTAIRYNRCHIGRWFITFYSPRHLIIIIIIIIIIINKNKMKKNPRYIRMYIRL